MCGRLLTLELLVDQPLILFDTGCAFTFLSALAGQQSGSLHCEQLGFQDRHHHHHYFLHCQDQGRGGGGGGRGGVGTYEKRSMHSCVP